MKPSQATAMTALFLGIFLTGNMFITDFWDNHGVESETSIEVQSEYDQLNQEIQGENNSIRSKVQSIQSPESGLFDKATAGLLLVPKFASVMLAPIGILLTVLQNIHVAFSNVLPGPFVTMIELLIVSRIAYGVFSIAAGVRS